MSHVVVTGIGVMSSCGRGLDPLVSAVDRRAPPLHVDPRLLALGSRCALFGPVPGVDEAFATLPLEQADSRYFGRFSRIGAVAACDAMEASMGARVGRVVVATATGPMGELESCFRDTLASEPHAHPAHAVTRVTPSFLATYLAAAFGAERGGHVVSAACTSALVALAQAHDAIVRGEEAAVLVGAVEEDCPSTYWAFDRQRQLSYASSVEERTRPLSGKLGGFVPAGGAGFFVLESEAHAAARGARVLGRLPRVATRSSRPAGASVLAFPKVAYEAALRDALVAGPVDLVLAHAPPTLADADELASIVGFTDAAVRSYKSVFGYTVGASAALDLALALAFLGRGHAPPNDFGPDAPSARAHGGALEAPASRLRRVAKMAYAQGFSAASLVVEAP